MHELFRFFNESYRTIGGALGIVIALIIVSLWVDRWSRVPLATIASSCITGIAVASIAAITRHVFKLPHYDSLEVWVGFAILNMLNFALVSLLFLARSFFFSRG